MAPLGSKSDRRKKASAEVFRPQEPKKGGKYACKASWSMITTGHVEITLVFFFLCRFPTLIFNVVFSMFLFNVDFQYWFSILIFKVFSFFLFPFSIICIFWIFLVLKLFFFIFFFYFLICQQIFFYFISLTFIKIFFFSLFSILITYIFRVFAFFILFSLKTYIFYYDNAGPPYTVQKFS